MKARISPTSPAASTKPDPVTAVWQAGQLQQPVATPWGKIILAIVLVGLFTGCAAVVGLGWYVNRFPTTPLKRYLPLASSTTTVIQPTKEKDTTVVPAAVIHVQQTAYAINRNQGGQGIYQHGDTTGYAWPLSGSGWLLSISGAWPADAKSLAILPVVGQPQVITRTVSDPASPYIFLKTDDSANQPMVIGTHDLLTPGLRVWVLTGSVAIPRQLTDEHLPAWRSSDQLEGTWSLDTTTDVPVGAAVVDVEGRLLGLMGSENRLWPAETLTDSIKQIIQTGSMERPTLGIQTLDLGQAIVTGQPSAQGQLIGAENGQVAITPKGPADKAGLKVGDIILTCENQPLNGELFTLLQNYHAGSSIKCSYQRQESTKNITLQLGTAHS